LLGALCSGCDTPSFGSHLKPRQIVELAAESAVQLESQYQVAPATDVGVESFRQVASAIAGHAVNLPKYVTLHFAVIESDEEIALSLPDGHIYISSGLLAKIADDPSEIACVLGHEVGHVALGHDVANLTAALGDSTVAAMLAQGQYQDVVDTELELSRLSYSDSQEAAADQYAVQLAKASGYDASSLLKFIAMIAAEPRSESDVYWDDTHPLFKQRAARMKEDIKRLTK
jgi:putative metalloprotease